MAAAVNRQDMAAMAEGLADDYISLEDAGRQVRGRTAYRAMVDSMAAAGTFHDLTYEPEGLDVGGDLAVRYGRWRLKYLPKGGDTVRSAGNFVHVWRRQGDGSWKLAREISNSVAPAPASPAPRRK
jgi:ketosteroid isomerase-like protein